MIKTVCKLDKYGKLAYRLFKRHIPFIELSKIGILIIAGFQDASLKVITLDKSVKPFSYSFHKNPISQMKFSHKYKLVVCGSQDFRLSIWSFNYDRTI